MCVHPRPCPRYQTALFRGVYALLRGTLASMDRLPRTRATTDKGFVYVLKRGNAYKVGFSRSNVRRQVRYNEGELLFTIPTGQRPAQLEYLINRRFAAKRLPNYNSKEGGKREWFALDAYRP